MASCLYHHPIGVFPLHVWFGAPLREENRSLSFATTTANTCLGGNTASPLVAQLRSSALCPTVKVICCPKNVVKSCVSAVLVHATFDQVYLDRRVCVFFSVPRQSGCYANLLLSHCVDRRRILDLDDVGQQCFILRNTELGIWENRI